MEATTTASTEAVATKNLSQEIINRVADREGANPTELTPPLYSAIDPEALDSLFSTTDTGKSQAPGRLQFAYKGYEITVQSDGGVSIAES